MMPASPLDSYTRSAFSATLGASLLFGVLALTGCSGAVSIPDTSVSANTIHPGAIQGSVFGGHAPIVGAHVYVFEAGKTGYASAATSELTTGSGTDSNGTYVMTDSSGAFNITDDYTCDAGEPVYLASVGGSSTANSSVTITAATFSENGNSGHYTVKFYAVNSLAFGQSVTFSGLTGGYSQLNGTTQTVEPPVTSTYFTIAFNGTKGLSGTTTGTAIFDLNSSIIDMAVLGLCPGTSGEFANTLSFVYINEVSTVAAAFAFSGFGSGPYDIGAKSTNLLGIQNAAVNAGQLYDIQGSDLSTTEDGEDHIARPTTPAGNGTVSQDTLDTLADIISTCVDSGGSTSTQCTTLFEYATSTGITFPFGTQPTDTATAMFNIAHFPAGTGFSSSSFMSKLYALQNSGIVPYTPNLAAQPNDFTVSISYTGGGLGTTNGESPHSVAIDASGNVYTVNYSTSLLNIFNPFGVPLSDTGFSGNGLNNPVSIAVDSTSQHLWVANFGSSDVSEFTTLGAAVNTYPLGESAQRDAEIDGSGNIWVATDTSNALVELTSGGTVEQTVTSDLDTPWCIAIEPGTAGNIWVTDETENDVTLSTSGGSTTKYGAGAITTPVGCAIDANSDVWLANSNGTLSALRNGPGANLGRSLGNSPFHSGSSNALDGIAMDGSDNIWVTNSTSQTLYEWSSAGNDSTLISPTNGYTAKPATSPDGIAIDPSGDVWYNSSSSDVLYELVGAATPVVTPISYAVANSKLGTQP